MSGTDDQSPPKVFIRTFGCQMNVYDSWRIARMLESCGYEDCTTLAAADIILFNTCSVRQKAEQKVYSELGKIKNIKKERPGVIVGVGGCVAQQEGSALLKKFPFIDVVFGTHALSRLPALMEKAAQGHTAVDIAMNAPDTLYPPQTYRPPSSRVSAFVTIMHGCNNYCSYCIVPYVRGPEYSRPVQDIISEITYLVAHGIKEVTLLGQNVNSYRAAGQDTSFADLLEMLDGMNGLERIRFTTSHPKDLSDELIGCFSRLNKLCKHIHLPLQSGSDKILNLMNRGYTRREYYEKVRRLRAAAPGIGITSDILVGFPGETDDDFAQTVALINDVRFDDLFLFHYTDRRGTRASQIKRKVPYASKIERLTMLKDIQKRISLGIHQKMIGATFPVLFEHSSKIGDASIAGRTTTNKLVNCRGPLHYLGTTRPVIIEKANIHSLTGSIVS